MPRCSQSSRCAKLFVNICFFPVASATQVAASLLVICRGRASSQLSSEQAARSVAWPGCCLLTTLDRLRCFFVGGAVITAEGPPRACSVAAPFSASSAASPSSSRSVAPPSSSRSAACSVASLSASASLSVSCGTRNASMDVAFVRCVLLRASRSPSAAVLWLSNRLHSCIIAMPLPEKVLVVFSVLTQLSPVARNTPSSQAENHIVRFAQKMNRRILCRASWTRVLFVASGALSALAMRRIPAMKGCMTGPSASCALERYFVM